MDAAIGNGLGRARASLRELLRRSDAASDDANAALATAAGRRRATMAAACAEQRTGVAAAATEVASLEAATNQVGASQALLLVLFFLRQSALSLIDSFATTLN